jgi:hypothetical protein
MTDGSTSNGGVIRDLMNKAADDAKTHLLRTLSLSDDKHLPIAIAAGAAVMGITGAILSQQSDRYIPADPDPESVLLAALIIARSVSVEGQDDRSDCVHQAFRDLDALREAGRLPAADTGAGS